jgi:hypothetical protein
MPGPVITNMLFSNGTRLLTELSNREPDSRFMMQHHPVVDTVLLIILVKKRMDLSANSVGCFYMIVEIHFKTTLHIRGVLCRSSWTLSIRSKYDEVVKSLLSRLCERSEAISQFISIGKIEIAASLRSSQ